MKKHLNLRPDLVDQRRGMHSVMKEEVKKLYNARTSTPMDVCVTLTSNKVHNKMYGAADLPTVRQVSKEIAKFMGEGDNVYEIVVNKLEALKYDPLRKYENVDTIGFGYLIGDGSEISHFIASFTSLELLEAIKHTNEFIIKAIYHIDATYKITKNRFPLIIIGRSDHDGTFHLISVSISSHEQECDFTHILNSLMELCKSLSTIEKKIEFAPTAFMQDACQASKNAIQSLLPKSELYMCWFHVMANVKK